VDEPHGVYTGMMSMDNVYFVRPISVRISRQDKRSNFDFSWNGSLVADLRQAITETWQRWTFSGGCDNINLIVGQIELGRWHEGEMLIGDHGPICSFKPVGNNVGRGELNPTSNGWAQAESAAVVQLRVINTAEVTFLASAGGKYGTIQDMISAGLLDARFANQVNGYSFDVRLQQQGRNYLAMATPVGNLGLHSFSSTSDAIIRYSAGPAGTPIGQPVQ
jgi:hypothetical protein